MWRTIIITVVLVTVTLAVALGMGGQMLQDTDDAAKLRVGVYDSRAIAIAYAHSEFMPMAAKMEAYQQAKQAGDEERVKQLEEWGAKHQRQLHRQGFGRVPVTNLLEHVEHRLPDLARELSVDVIAFECNYLGANVEEVDITLDLVKLYDPSERTMKMVRETLKIDPVDLDEIEQGHDD